VKLSRLLIYVLLVVAIVILCGTWLNQPTIGYPQAKVHVVVFEEPKCSDCKVYDLDVFPKIKQEFIDTNQIIYTVIPVSFLPNSSPGAMALLCVYNQDPGYPNADLVIQLLDRLLQTEWTTLEEVVKIAEMTSPAIDLVKLRNCINQSAYEAQLASNLDLGKKLGDGKLSVPSLYVNGIRVKGEDYSSIKAAILKSLNQ
jgi:protein-disulfide isomerase